MFKKNYTDFVEDMLETARDILNATENLSFQDFKDDMYKYRTVERLFEILGEAANRIPKEIQQNYPEVPWKNIIGMRNIIIHSYEKVDLSTLWGAVKKDVHLLIKPLEKMLEEV